MVSGACPVVKREVTGRPRAGAIGGQGGGPAAVLHLQQMETIGVRELQQHASSTLRRVERGESVGVTDRGRLVAVLVPPSAAAGSAGLVAAGRVQAARRAVTALAPPTATPRATGDVLDELRAER